MQYGSDQYWTSANLIAMLIDPPVILILLVSDFLVRVQGLFLNNNNDLSLILFQFKSFNLNNFQLVFSLLLEYHEYWTWGIFFGSMVDSNAKGLIPKTSDTKSDER